MFETTHALKSKRLFLLNMGSFLVGCARAEALLDGLDLLRDGGEHALLEPVELVETAPGAARGEAP